MYLRYLIYYNKPIASLLVMLEFLMKTKNDFCNYTFRCISGDFEHC